LRSSTIAFTGHFTIFNAHIGFSSPLDAFALFLEKIEGSHRYQEKSDKKRLPVLSILQRTVYDALPVTFVWTQGKEAALQAGMPLRTAQRFFANRVLFDKVKNGAYAKKIIFTEV